MSISDSLAAIAARVDTRALRIVAEAAARAGGELARARFGSQLRIQHKPDGSEVTDADEAAQAAVIDAIRRQRGDCDGFVTEETLEFACESDAEVTWVIDPIDGTRNFLRGLPLYACSVAAMAGGFPVAGAIYVPSTNEMYSASAADGFLHNGQVIRPALSAGHADTAVPSPRSGKWLAAVPSSVDPPLRGLLDRWIERFVLRALGSAALHLVMVADGQVQAALFCDAKLWDIVGGWIMIHMTGGVVVDPAGKPLFPLDLQTYQRTDLPCIAAGSPEILRASLATT